MRYAECRTEDPELFFPIGNKGQITLAHIADAKAVCDRCEVRTLCLNWALELGAEHGVWGGMSEDERKPLHKSHAKGRRIKHR